MRLSAPILFCALLLSAGRSTAQTLRLQENGTGAPHVQVAVGDVVRIALVADLGSHQASGFSAFIAIPADIFQIVDVAPSRAGVQPFLQGPLFAPAPELVNAFVPPQELPEIAPTIRLLNYEAVIGFRGDRQRTGSGVVATFSLHCIRRVEDAPILLHDTPVRQTRLVLSDGTSERPFSALAGMRVTVSAIDLLDIPNVSLLPGRVDSVQIGRLDRYVRHNRAPLDSLRWTLGGAHLDSLSVHIAPQTRRVHIRPLQGWTGRRRVSFTVFEPSSPVPGESPPSDADIADITVNTPPRFRVRRDSVRLMEDQHTFRLPPLLDPDPARAFVDGDLDALVDDPEARDPDTAFRYAVLNFHSEDDTLSKVRARVTSSSHHLLLWTRPDFAGTDSVRVVVADEFGGQDTLRVIVLVDEVPDAPRFILADSHLRLRQGGSKTLPLGQFIFDADTPLEHLRLTWTADSGGRFSVERQPGALLFRGPPDFAGQGLFVFTVADPDSLTAQLAVRITALPRLPPRIFPREVPARIKPLGPPFSVWLDTLVEDPDDDDSTLVWQVAPGRRSRVDIDAGRLLRLSAPGDFAGYEQVWLAVADQDAQRDSLALRVYSSPGPPVVGGLPDVHLEPGESLSPVDLDEYAYAADFADSLLAWETSGQRQVRVDIDAQTHRVVFSVPDSARQSVERIAFRARTPDNSSVADTLLVHIGPRRIPGFQIAPLPPLRVQKGESRTTIDLDDFVQVSPGDPRPELIWGVRTLDSTFNALVSLSADHVVRLLGRETGADSVAFFAVDARGRRREAGTLVEVIDPAESLRLNPIPDMDFVAGHIYVGPDLDDFVVDPRTHPDSVLHWNLRFFTASPLLVQIQEDHKVLATASQAAVAQVVFIATNPRLQTSARDTVLIVAVDTSLGLFALLPLPEITFAQGRIDSSVHLDRFLPRGFAATDTLWRVSGQTLVAATIAPRPPHALRLESVPGRIGLDTLHFTVDLGRGYQARGDLRVRVLETGTDTTLTIRVVPHPLQREFLAVYVLSTRPLASAPSLLRSGAGADQSVSLGQLETDLQRRGLLIWSGSTRLPPGSSGTISFRAAAQTQLGTALSATASLAFARGRAGKAALLQVSDTRLELPADAVEEGLAVFMQIEELAVPEAVGELSLRARLHLHPEGLRLRAPAHLRFSGGIGEGLYAREGETWGFAARAGGTARLDRLVLHGILRDGEPPRLRVYIVREREMEVLVVEIEEQGSGVDWERLRFLVDGLETQAQHAGGTFVWSPPPDLSPGPHSLELRVADRAGNEALWREERSFLARPLPTRFALGASYPNPFNPEVRIPFEVPAPAPIHLCVYNLAGQQVRELVDRVHPAGYFTASWDGRDQEGRPAATGVYLYRLKTPDGALSRRMTLLR